MNALLIDGQIYLMRAFASCLQYDLRGGVDLKGRKNVLGIWFGEHEGAHYWLGIMNELNNRGVDDILITCVDGLKGFPEAINSAFPKTEAQLCIVHMIRNSIKYVGLKYQKEFIADLKTVYKAPSEDEAAYELDKLIAKKYPLAINPWKNHLYIKLDMIVNINQFLSSCKQVISIYYGYACF